MSRVHARNYKLALYILRHAIFMFHLNTTFHDIQQSCSRYIGLGVECDDASFFERRQDRHVHTAVDVAVHNVSAYIHEALTATPYATSAAGASSAAAPDKKKTTEDKITELEDETSGGGGDGGVTGVTDGSARVAGMEPGSYYQCNLPCIAIALFHHIFSAIIFHFPALSVMHPSPTLIRRCDLICVLVTLEFEIGKLCNATSD